MKRKTKVTMNDIARAAGVSQATVSLVLNQSRNIKLSDDTRQRVINVATELGYDRLPRRSRPAQPGRDRPAGELHAELRPVYRRHQPGAGSGVAQRDVAHRLRLRRRHRAGAEHHPPAGETQLHRDYSRLSGHHAGGHDGLRDCTRIPLVLLNQRDPGSPLLPSFIPDDYANAFR